MMNLGCYCNANFQKLVLRKIGIVAVFVKTSVKIIENKGHEASSFKK